MSKSLHANRKVVAGDPNAQNEELNHENISRISLLDKAFQRLNQETFDELTFLEFCKHFPAALIEKDEVHLRELHSEFIYKTSSAVQVFIVQLPQGRFFKFRRNELFFMFTERVSFDPLRSASVQEIAKTSDYDFPQQKRIQSRRS